MVAKEELKKVLPGGTLFCVSFVRASILQLQVSKDSAQQFANKLVSFEYKWQDGMQPLHNQVRKNAPASQKGGNLRKRDQMPL